MGILLNSWQVLTKEWNSILGVVGIFLLGGAIVISGLKIIFDDRLTWGEYLALGAGGGTLPVLLGISLAWLFDIFFALKVNFILICLVMLAVCVFAAYRLEKWRIQPQGSKTVALALGLVLVISVYIRLAFISGLIMPLYFDSAMHYALVRELITNFETSTLPTYSSFVGGYYHLGFHVLVAAFSLVLQTAVQDVMLIFGQVALACLPLPLFFIVRQETKMDAPALFATLLAGWGWYMPAHAINWGKYPALTSMLAFEFVLCGAYLVLRAHQRRRWLLGGMLALSIAATTFIHTRALVLVMLAFGSALLAAGWHRLPRLARNLVFGLGLAGLATLILIIESKPILRAALDPYQGSVGWLTLVVFLTAPFALRAFPRAATACLLMFIFLLASLLVSVTRFLPVYTAQTLLDRPYVEIAMFAPLAFLGGLGYAGMLSALQNSGFWQPDKGQKLIKGFIALALFGALGLNLGQYNFLPSSCCKLFNENDAVALGWMDKNIPANASILISATTAAVFEYSLPSDTNGSDAGVWITPLIQRNVILFPSQADFGAQNTRDQLCKLGITHIYAGSTEQSFDTVQLQKLPAWYELLLSLPQAQVYKIIGCP